MVESLDGWFLTVHPDTGAVTVREPEPGWFERRRLPFQRRGGSARGSISSSSARESSAPLPPPLFAFRLAHPSDAARQGTPVRFGEPVSLVVVDSPRAPTAQVLAGAGASLGGAAWKSGSVLAVHMQRGAELAALSDGAAYAALGGAAIEGAPLPSSLRAAAQGGGRVLGVKRRILRCRQRRHVRPQ
jgi:hypothetical protein